MSYLLVSPEMVTSKTADAGRIGTSLPADNAAAAGPTAALVNAAGDEVFSRHSQGYRALAEGAAAFHDQFLRAVNAGTGSSVAAEVANLSPLQSAVDATTPGGDGGAGGTA